MKIRKTPSRRVGSRLKGYTTITRSPALLVVLFIVSLAVIVPVMPLAEPSAQDLSNVLQPPGAQGHILGTDGLGQDMLSRLLHGARLTLLIAILGVAFSAMVGGLLGLAA